MTSNSMAEIKLVEMREAHFQTYREDLAREYAADKVRAGVWSRAEAGGRARRELDELLPEGPATPGHSLYSVRDESVPAEVGNVWFAVIDSGVGRSLWIYDLIIHEQFRRRGYARRTLELVEEKAVELGARRVELHVFGHNHGARTLYEEVGYGVTSIIMAKPVSAEGG